MQHHSTQMSTFGTNEELAYFFRTSNCTGSLEYFQNFYKIMERIWIIIAANKKMLAMLYDERFCLFRYMENQLYQ
uniref:Uncharacterized protein n=1 Tax=Romanomermis culicivorax TaxID=13658 RepID=A0A915I7C0_ROMCU